MSASKTSPVEIQCASCGAPAEFDILRQKYRCPACGNLTDTGLPKAQKRAWREARQEEFLTHTSELGEVVYSCADCGASVVIAHGEATGKCDFCGGKYVRRAFAASDSLPELVIPFFINRDEAIARLTEWCDSHKKLSESVTVRQNVKHIQGFYLPFQLVRGPVSCRVMRDNTARTYQCSGFVDSIAVNTSSQLDNLVLEAAEPFDWDDVREFDFGYLAGQKVKLQDSSENELKQRVYGEVKSNYTATVEKTLQNKGVTILPSMDDMLIMPALMPFYVLKAGKLTAVVNGQTGRVAVSAKKNKEKKPWLTEPIAITISALLVSLGLMRVWYGAFTSDAVLTAVLFTFVIAAIAFTVFGRDRKSKITRPIYQGKNEALARNENGFLVSARHPVKERASVPPVFVENISGVPMYVKVSFYPPGRVILWTLAVIAFVMLPVIIGAMFSDGRPIWLGGAAVWWCIFGVVVPAYFMKFGRVEVYNHPVLRGISESGKLTHIPKRLYRSGSSANILKILFAPGIRWLTIAMIAVLVICSALVASGG